MPDPRPDEVARRARDVRRAAVISGAGVSSESGIPTFRGAGGLWRTFRAEDLATPGAFARDPRLVWEFYEYRRGVVAAAEPNPAHVVIAAMENYYPEFLVITQNIDGLHARAGSRHILEIHGNLWKQRCTACGLIVEDHTVPLPTLPPVCGACGAMTRPHVVWFGESYDSRTLEQALGFLSACDLVFVVGTSGMVPMPIYLTEHAVAHGAYAIEFNLEASALSDHAHALLPGPAGQTMPAFWDAVTGGA